MTQIIDRSGKATQVDLSLEDYKEAYDTGVSLSQHLNQKFDTDAEKYGTPFEQALASNGMFLTTDHETGIKPPSMKEVLDGKVDVNMGAITRPDGSNAQTLTGRLLFPAVVEQMIESEMRTDNSTYEGVFNRMVATTVSADSPRIDQPIINLTAPRGVRSQPIAQLAEPASMVTISLSEKSIRLPTLSVGIEISDEAQQAATLDLVGIALAEQLQAERALIVDEAIQKMVNGDTDLGMAGLTPESASVYDSALAAGQISHTAWLKWLRKDWKKMTIDWVITDLDTYLKIENRAGRPIITDNDGSGRLNSLPSLANPGLPDNVNFFVVDTALIGANTLIGLDSSRAIRRAVYTGASYSAVEAFVLRRSTAMRIDFSLNYFRLIDQAWKKLFLG